MSSTEGKRLKILVCKPRLAIQTIRLNRFIRCEPLELEYLYTVLQHHDVYLLDAYYKAVAENQSASHCITWAQFDS